MKPEPILDLAHLGHMELLTPKDESLKFFVDVMGMTISGRKGDSVYLRGWDDYERCSLKLTVSNTSGMEHMALRACSPQALQRRVAALRLGVRDRLDRGRHRSRPRVPLPRSGRPYH